ncbi:D-aminoacylase [Siccirubricoccus deserti]|uniref:D-aminoacylase n=1 Tax=Siccirubricoccus deserti TaxID=2013562 RepID=A0A9X0UBI1_9PROT|nr:D-aminoacylase [Siccirubricoccus deserti]MBC4013899.1 D-aminoacylase [Siccirubricoccus deserti]GGC30395.1 D-aminoacylase [Siccirubricoccus deserti]
MALRCDLIIRDATLFDGTGAPRSVGDVGVTGDRITAVGDLGGASADREVIATGRALAPGFIDAHTHDDRAVLCGPQCLHCKSSQGVTTVVVGNCGVSLAPLVTTKRPVPPLDLVGEEGWWRFGSFGDYTEALRKSPAAVNTYAMVGHQTLRYRVMGEDLYRPAKDAEIAEMRRIVAESLAEGASGFSTGLYYKPNMHAPTEEVIAVAEPLRAAGGIYVTHMRDEADRVCASIEETLKIGKRVGVPVWISHHKCSLPENYGRSTQTLALIEAAAAMQEVFFDMYPYPAGSTVLMPDRLREDCRVIITWSIPHPEVAGKDLAEVARGWNTDIRTAAEKLLPAGAITFQMDEEDVRRIMAHPMSVIGSDGIPHDAHPHPRLWGTFPRVLGLYSRQLGLLDMETAIHKMTGRTAALFGMTDRGVLKPGAYADLVLFDPHRIIDRATFEDPKQPSEGIEEVWTNGVSTYRGASGLTGEAPGRLIRRRRD